MWATNAHHCLKDVCPELIPLKRIIPSAPKVMVLKWKMTISQIKHQLGNYAGLLTQGKFLLSPGEKMWKGHENLWQRKKESVGGSPSRAAGADVPSAEYITITWISHPAKGHNDLWQRSIEKQSTELPQLAQLCHVHLSHPCFASKMSNDVIVAS